jgi:DNA-binding LacI/PurR family transcriptional regulator
MRTLNYRPNPAARRRVTSGRRRTVGFLLREIANPYYAEIITGAEEYLSEHGYTILSAASGGNFSAEKQIVEAFTQKDVDGLLLTPVLNDETDLAHIFDLKRHNVSFVLLEAIHGIQANLVDVDAVDGAQQAVRHLIDLGHTRIRHFAGPEYSLHSDQRIRGVRAAYSESHLVFTDQIVVPTGDSLEDGYRAGLRYFREWSDDRPTAVSCYNDLVALGVCRALRELKLRVPQDVSVVGYDDLKALDYIAPRLTSIRVPKREVGETAAKMLYEEIESGAPQPPQMVYLRASLVVGESTSAPAPDGQAP